MNYCYFGNTTLKTGKLLYNIEAQLILFKELFNEATKDDVWTNNSELQYKYQELLIQHDLLKTNDNATGSKNARAKSAPLEDYGLIKRKEKRITELGEELLTLLNQEKFKEYNNFLQIDLVSLFFFKATLNYVKDSDKKENIFLNYLKVFKSFMGKLDKEHFYLLPTICNFDNVDDFISKLKDPCLNALDFLSELLYQDEKIQTRRLEFFQDIANNDFANPEYFKSAKGINAAHIVIEMYHIFLSIRNVSYSKNILKDLFKTKVNGRVNHYKNLYLSYLFEGKMSITKSSFITNYKTLIKFARKGSDEEFNNRFFDLIYSSRALNNLEDYYQLNKYYLYLTGIFDFKPDKISLTETVNIILQNTNYEDIINKISTEKVSTTSLDYLVSDVEIQSELSALGLSSIDDLKTYKYNQNKDKLEQLLNSNFTKNNIIEKILPLFKPRQDNDIFNLVSEYATIPTIFEYILAIAWYYIDNKNIDFILNAGLSLDSNMLPKSHAVGGNSDFEIRYHDHTLMIEVTLTESTNQRRAEMESVSRHLGNILLNISDEEIRNKTFGIFVATFLNKNVLNDFRLRKLSYWENDINCIQGMNIIPLDTDDVICILKSDKIYSELRQDLYNLIEVEEKRGSLWYSRHIKPYITSLQC